uniref:Maturase K n=1 Tax=Tetrodontium brownianum TaxID=188018 RepID=A0A0F7VKE4_9BRYO|nr:maturase K [Tetrodontium brownianum]
MRTIAGVLSKMEELQGTRKSFLWQQRFLYPLLFQDDLYTIAYNRFLNKIDLKKIESSNSKENFSFLTLKRLIFRIRQKIILQKSNKNYNRIIDINYNNNFYSRAIREGVTAILEIFFYRELRKNSIKELHECTGYQSIHSVFPFIEDNFLHSNYILNIKIPYFLHPELLIRIFRRRIQDPFFLHSLRYILHKNKKLIILDTNYFFYQKKTTRLAFFLWHSYIYELESFLVNIWKNLNYFKSLSYFILLDQTNCIRKIQHVINPSWSKLQYFFFCKKKTSFHYMKYQNNYILSIKSSKYLAEKWKFFFWKFWQYYFHFSFEPYKIRIKKISKSCFPFLGYIFGIRTKTSIIRTKMLDDLPKSSFANKEIYFITPTSSLIGLLARERFCDIIGHPISKLAWTTLADDEIFNRFNQIWKNIFYYYSGCINKKNLYQIQYILRFSCAKTLACKHKSTIRFIWKKHGSNYFAKSFFLKKQELICSNFSTIYPFIKKIWYLDIIQINSLAKSLHKKNNE